MLSKILIIRSHSSFYNFSIDFCDIIFPIHVDNVSFWFMHRIFHLILFPEISTSLRAFSAITHSPSKINSNSICKNYFKRRKTEEKSWRNFTHDGGRAVCLRNIQKTCGERDLECLIAIGNRLKETSRDRVYQSKR